MKTTGIKDRNNKIIKENDWVSLDGNITADNSFGLEPNGWFFDEEDVYQVYWDERIKNWSLKLNLEPDTRENVKYMNHAVSLLHDGEVTIVKNNKKTKNKKSDIKHVTKQEVNWKELAKLMDTYQIAWLKLQNYLNK